MPAEIKGQTVIFTGDGKGKTSAALGVALRAMGHGMKCSVYQFIKGRMDTGELHIVEKLNPLLEIKRVGKGFTRSKAMSIEQHRMAAQDGFTSALKDLSSGEYGVFIMDEILYALGKGLVDLEQLFDAIEKKPDVTHLIFTGRGAPRELIEKVDMVSEINQIKHPFQSGIPAQKGLDY